MRYNRKKSAVSTGLRKTQPFNKALCVIRKNRLAKIIGFIALLIIVFCAGYLVASWQFVYSTTYILNEPLTINGTQGDGVLPKGTTLHYQSVAHGEVDFYTFIRIPKDEVIAKTQEIEVDTYNGIKRLRSSAK